MHAPMGNTPALTMTVEDLAQTFRVSVDRFRQIRPRLEAEGFPRRIPGAGHRWSAPAVHHWISSNAGSYAPLSEGTATDAADPVAAAQAQLENRYGYAT